MKIRTYTGLLSCPTFLDRYRYLSLRGIVGRSTFGFDRYVNQRFYRSREWRQIRQEVIVRDNGCDLAAMGYDITTSLLIHHMNPISVEDINERRDEILNPMFLISTTHDTHNAIHYGDESLLPRPKVPRRPGDTRLW